MFCTNSNLCVNLNSNIIEEVATIYIYKLLECIQWQLMCIATAQRLHTTSHGPQPPSNDPSFLIAFHFEINLISTSGLDLTRTRSCGPYFFYVTIYVTTCFLSLASTCCANNFMCKTTFVLCQLYLYEYMLDFAYSNLNLICVATHVYNKLYFVTNFFL